MFVLCHPGRDVSRCRSGTPRLSDPPALPPLRTRFVSRLPNEPGCCAEAAPCSPVRARATLNTDHGRALPAFPGMLWHHGGAWGDCAGLREHPWDRLYGCTPGAEAWAGEVSVPGGMPAGGDGGKLS